MNALRSLAALALLVPSAAAADVAPPPVESLECPRGAVGAVPQVDPEARDPRGRPVQPWPYCAPSACASDDDCDGGRVCSRDEIGLCVVTQSSTDATRRVAIRRPCEPDGTCLNVQAECEVARRCVDPSEQVLEAPEESAEALEDEAPSPPAPEARAGCACRATPSGTPAPWALVGLLGVLLFRRR